MPALLRRSTLALTLALGAALAGCDDAEELGSSVRADVFEDGVSRDTDGGAFRVALFSRDGLDVGDNQLIVRVGFHDPGDPAGLGFGVPSAQVHLDAFALDGTTSLLDLEGVYMDDGRYAVDGLELDPGVWQLQLRIEVGATIDESVEFVFDIAG